MTLSKYFFVGISLIFLLSLSLFFSGVSADDSDIVDQVTSCSSLSGDKKDRCYEGVCDSMGAKSCASYIFDAVVSERGVGFAMNLVDDLSDFSFFNSIVGESAADTIDLTFLLAKEVGGASFRHDSDSDDAFLRCSTGFSRNYGYGCQQGFFNEYLKSVGFDAFVPLPSVAERFCDGLSDNDRMRCYHQMGHVFFKHGRDDPYRVCEELSDFLMISHCLDGAFMEASHRVLHSDDYNRYGHSSDDPLSPCNLFVGDFENDLYTRSCYHVHGQYLLRRHSDSQDDALRACEGAGEYVEVCRYGVLNADSNDHHNDFLEDDSDGVWSWFRTILNSIASLFGWGGEEHVVDVPDAVAPVLSRVLPADFAAADVVTVLYENGVYTPDRVEISPGQEVVWVSVDDVFWPASNLHPTHVVYPGSDIRKCGTDERALIFDACEALDPALQYSFVFHEVGEWRYHDHINPSAAGVVVVSE